MGAAGGLEAKHGNLGTDPKKREKVQDRTGKGAEGGREKAKRDAGGGISLSRYPAKESLRSSYSPVSSHALKGNLEGGRGTGRRRDKKNKTERGKRYIFYRPRGIKEAGLTAHLGRKRPSNSEGLGAGAIVLWERREKRNGASRWPCQGQSSARLKGQGGTGR